MDSSICRILSAFIIEKGMESCKNNLSSAMLDEIAEIAKQVGHVNATAALPANPVLRRTN